jgi:hypothetical protein
MIFRDIINGAPFLVLAFALSTVRAPAQLEVTFNFDDFGTSGAWGNLFNDSWDGSTSDSIKQAAAETVIRTAGDYWEAAYANSTTSLTQTIEVDWGAGGGGTLASGGTSYFDSPPDYPFATGSLTWDNDGTSNFFVDLTPWEDSEYNSSSFRTDDLGGGTIPLERSYYNPNAGTSERANHDMLTVAIHEVGHALGLLGGYPPYGDLDIGSDGDLDLVDGTQVAYSGGHISHTLSLPGSSGYPYDGVSISTYYPAVMGPSVVISSRKLPAALDVLALASVHGFDNYDLLPVIPEPGTLSLALLGGLALLVRRRR